MRMLKKQGQQRFAYFDVVYADGTRTSRRRILETEGDAQDENWAKTHIMEQDRKIAEMSGHDRGRIMSLTRSPNTTDKARGQK
jgi:metal-responsive CopG/Arc/MetJ family transcriptional regulator